MLLLFVFFVQSRLATSRPLPLGEGSEPFLAAKRPTASDEVARGPAPYEIRRRTFLKVYVQGIWEIFTCGIWNPRLWNPEYSSRIPNATNDCSNDKEAGIRYLESGIRSQESTGWNPETVLDSLTWGDFLVLIWRHAGFKQQSQSGHPSEISPAKRQLFLFM